MNPLALSLAALVPLMTGPLPGETRQITARLCDGAGANTAVAIPLEPRAPLPRPCAIKGCHAGSCRKRSGAAI